MVAPLSQMSTLRDARGRYSIVSRRLTPLQEFTSLAANTEADIVVSNLSGCVTEIIVEAYPHDANLDACDTGAPVMLLRFDWCATPWSALTMRPRTSAD